MLHVRAGAPQAGSRGFRSTLRRGGRLWAATGSPRNEPLSATSENTQTMVLKTYERAYPQGGIVFEQGDAGDVLFVIQSGEIELSRKGPDGWRSISKLGPGDFFGEMSVILGEARTARAVATRQAKLLELDAATLEGMCVDRPEIAIRLLQLLTGRLIEAERRLSALGIDDLLRPLIRALVRQAKSDPDSGIRIETSLRALSQDAGLSMAETHQALHQLLDQKAVRLVNDVLHAKDVDTLTSCLDVAT